MEILGSKIKSEMFAQVAQFNNVYEALCAEQCDTKLMNNSAPSKPMGR